jgi:hypothetical protein
MTTLRCEACKMTAAVTGDEPQAVHCEHCGSELGTFCEACTRDCAPRICLGCQSHGVGTNCDLCGKPSEELMQRANFPGIGPNNRAPMICNECVPFDAPEVKMCACSAPLDEQGRCPEGCAQTPAAAEED